VMDDHEEFARDLLYWIAYGDAWRWVQIQRYNHAFGKESAPGRIDHRPPSRENRVRSVRRRLFFR
jgi:hypothetical protein